MKLVSCKLNPTIRLIVLSCNSLCFLNLKAFIQKKQQISTSETRNSNVTNDFEPYVSILLKLKYKLGLFGNMYNIYIIKTEVHFSTVWKHE